MRIAPTSPISHHRLARLMSWAGLWLAGFVVAALAYVGARAWRPGLRRQLDCAARMLAQLLFLNAAARVRAPPRRVKRPSWRALVGSKLWRRLHGGDGWARLAALIVVLRDARIHIARIAQRLARGLTRLRVLAPAPDADAVIAPAPTAAIAYADTS